MLSTMALERFHGVFAVLQVPCHEELSIDYGALAGEIDWNFENGLTGVVLALASEVFRLTDAERDELAILAAQVVARRGPVYRNHPTVALRGRLEIEGLFGSKSVDLQPTRPIGRLALQSRTPHPLLERIPCLQEWALEVG